MRRGRNGGLTFQDHDGELDGLAPLWLLGGGSAVGVGDEVAEAVPADVDAAALREAALREAALGEAALREAALREAAPVDVDAAALDAAALDAAALDAAALGDAALDDAVVAEVVPVDVDAAALGEAVVADVGAAALGAAVACAADEATAEAGAGGEDPLEGVGLGADDAVGDATGQVTTADVSVCTGCFVVTAAETAGAGVVEASRAGVAGTTGAAVAETSWAGAVETTGGGVRVAGGRTFVTLGRALAAAVAVPDGQVPAVAGCVSLPGVVAALGVLPWLLALAPGAAPFDGGVPCPAPTVCVPVASVPAVARCDPPPPCSTVPACMMASRTGWTPSMMLAMTATTARTAASRSGPVPNRGKAAHRSRGHRASARRDNHAGWAQCPRHVQFLARSTTPSRTLGSQGRGGRPAIRARILSSPSLPGSTPLAVSDRARRSASSRSSSPGEVMPSSHPPARSLIAFLVPRPA